MNLILNRNFELPDDDWYQLAPLGEFPHGGAGVNQVIDADACTRMVAAFENSRSQSKNFPACHSLPLPLMPATPALRGCRLSSAGPTPVRPP